MMKSQALNAEPYFECIYMKAKHRAGAALRGQRLLLGLKLDGHAVHTVALVHWVGEALKTR